MALIGTGLLGASLGLAVRAAAPSIHRVGIARRQEPLDEALACGAIDEGSLDLTRAAQADWIIFCAPLDAFRKTMLTLAPLLAARADGGAGVLMLDVGSVKQPIVAAAQKELPDGVAFVGCHPMAGREKYGPSAALANLFNGKPVVITPIDSTPPDAVAAAQAFWEMLGMKPHIMTPQEHDRVVAQISHVPHIVSALVALQITDDNTRNVASTGFADVARLAMGHAGLWADILCANREEVLKALREIQSDLELIRSHLVAGDQSSVDAWLENARQELLRVPAVCRNLNTSNEN